MTLLIYVIHFVMFLVKFFMWPVIRLINLFKTRKMVSPITNPLLLYSAKKLAFMIRTGQITSEQVIRAYILRIEEVNPILNAVVEDRFEAALQEAIAVDKFLEKTKKTIEEIERDAPLLGVPLTVKESLAVKGLSNQAGVVHSEIRRAEFDAPIVGMCRNAGAIPLLVSNTPELCLYWESYNNVTGRTLNPYDTRRTVGGSSGGEAALLGSGASVIGLGSDICGSLRLPAMFTGVYGHKPTADTIPVDGHVPGCTDSKWTSFFVTGPMSRYAEDLPLLLSIIAKPERSGLLKWNEEINMRDIKVFYMEDKTNRETIEGMENFALYLERQYGTKAQKVDIKLLHHAFEIAVPLLLTLEEIECPFYNSETKEFSIGKELFDYVTFRSNHVLHVILFGIFKKTSAKLIPRSSQNAAKLKEKLVTEFRNLLGDNGVLLYPTFTNVAHFHNEVMYKILETSYLSIFNVLGFPVTSCPLSYNSDGLPYGLQIIANPFNDRLTVTVAQEIEKAFGGWKPNTTGELPPVPNIIVS